MSKWINDRSGPTQRHALRDVVVGTAAFQPSSAGGRLESRPSDLLAIVAFLMFACARVNGQFVCAPSMEWQQSYGGTNAEQLFAAQQTFDGGFVLGGDRSVNSTNTDFWVVRTDSAGNPSWNVSFGGNNADSIQAVAEVQGGGFVFAGPSSSGPDGTKTAANYGGTDFWIVRTDANGVKQWDRSFGGSGEDYLTSLAPLPDGGYILGGYSSSPMGSGTKTNEHFGDFDFWIIRLDANGSELWERSFGGTGADLLYKVRPVPGGGFILVGASESNTNSSKTATNLGGWDYWVIRLAADGSKLWEKSLGGSADDYGRDVVEDFEGGFIVAGSSMSQSGNEKWYGTWGLQDFWVARLTPQGAKEWDRGFGGTGNDQLESVSLAPGGRVLLGGYSFSEPGGTKASPLYGEADYWVVGFHPSAYDYWDLSFGGELADYGRSVGYVEDGGLIVAGNSASEPAGNKTSAHLGDSDFWLVKLRPETPGDCDGDGVADEQDLCPSTAPATVVDSRGCSIEQSCPCDRPWNGQSNYVNCVRQVSGEFLRDGLINEAQRDALIQAALQRHCPPAGFGPETVIAFGFTNVAIADASFCSTDGDTVSDVSRLTACNLDFVGRNGMAVLLGEADSGLFFYPDAPVSWGNYDPNNFMLGKAFGRVNGVDNHLIAGMRAAKTYYEYYPVYVDLSPLGPTSLTFQVLNGNTVTAQRTVTGAVGRLVVHSPVELDPRANPFWRMPDGSVGALIEFTTLLQAGFGEYGTTGVEIPGQEPEGGNRVFIRADNPTNHVDFVSRFEVYGGGGIPNCSMVDGQIGMFNLPNRMVGLSVFGAANGELRLQHLYPNAEEPPFHGVIIELNSTALFDMVLHPVTLASNEYVASFVTANVNNISEGGDPFIDRAHIFTAVLTNRGEFIELSADVYALQASNVVVEIYKHGSLAGQNAVTSNVLGRIAGANGLLPRLVGWTTVGHSNSPPRLSLSFDRYFTFNGNNTALEGDLIRLLPGTTNRVLSLAAASLQTTHLSVTIRNESTSIRPPRLNLAGDETNLVLSWEQQNQPFVLESAESLPGPFETVTNEPALMDGTFSLSRPLQTESTRFFRLRLNN